MSLKIWKRLGSNHVLFITGFLYGISYDKNGRFSPNKIVSDPINTICMRILSGLTCGGITIFVSYFTPENISPIYTLMYGLSWHVRYASRKLK